MRGFRTGLAVAVVLVALPASASAGTAKVEEVVSEYDYCGTHNSLVFFDNFGHANKLIVSLQDVLIDTGIGFVGPCNDWATRSTTAYVSDSAFPVTAGNGCRSYQPKVALCGVAGGFDSLGTTRVYLGEGSDSLALELSADPHPSVIYAGGGNDTLRTLNGSRDTVDCGPGTDTVTRDGKDVLTNCEIVTG